MKKRWLIGAVLFVSLAANATLVGMLMGRSVPAPVAERLRPMEMVLERVESLPEPEQEKVRAIIQQTRPQIVEATLQLRDARKDMFAFMGSAEYTREAGEKRFAELRAHTNATQKLAQTMMLDIADALTPKQRAEFVKRKPHTPPPYEQ
ncbi:MAG: periplasmic heavy metal sensor [Rickettsiales bacterium]|nr:periplasmic heavy metal sensor [Rickettsiales bacterium]